MSESNFKGLMFWVGISVGCGIVFFVFRGHIFTEQKTIPKIKKEVQKTQPPPPIQATSLLIIKTNPVGVVVYLDNKKVGITPLTLDDYPAGTYDLLLQKSCYRSEKQKIIINAGVETFFDLDLHVVCGDLQVTSEPSGADVVINGKKRGKTPFVMQGVRVGEHTLQVQQGAAQFDYSLNVKAGVKTKYWCSFLKPRKPKHLTAWQDPLTGMRFIWVDGGCYAMGNAQSDELREEIAERNNNKVGSFFKSIFTVITDTGEEEDVRDYDIDEGPVHEVCVDGVWVGKQEVTNQQYLLFSKATGTQPEWLRDDSEYNVETGESEYYATLGGGSFQNDTHPVVGVSWQDVTSFCRWFSVASGNSVRLLSEAEWEYVCRSSGKEDKFAGGGDPYSFAWYADNSDNVSHEVGQLDANDLGLFDLSGNVWEWTLDQYDSEAYAQHARMNPVHQKTGGDSRRVVRGGSWRSKEKSLRCTARYGLPSTESNAFLGFRVVMEGGE